MRGATAAIGKAMVRNGLECPGAPIRSRYRQEVDDHEPRYLGIVCAA